MMNFNFKTNYSIAAKKTKQFQLSSEFKNKTKFIKGSLIAIISGFVVAGLIVGFLNVNPFVYFAKMFEVGFTDLYLATTLNWASIYIVAGIAVAIGFKSGVFNIGLPGQILGASGVSTVVVWSILDKNATTMNGGLILLVFLICVVTSAFLAYLAGILKAMFNIHEVVTTILLNWAIWYLFKYVFMTFTADFGSPLAGASKAIPEHMLDVNGIPYLIPLIIAGICVVLVGLMFAKTTLGFKLRAVGSSPTASKYAGINIKNKVIIAMTLSGAFAGIAAFLNVMTIDPNTYFGSDSLPTLGFDAIAVALVVFNNPVGIVFSGLLWGTIKNAGEPISSLFGIPTQISGLVTGIIIYFAAIAVIFMHFKPYQTMKNWYYICKSKHDAKLLRILYHEKMKLSFMKYLPCLFKNFRDELKSFDLKTEKKEFKEQFKANMTMKINHLNNQISTLKKAIINNYVNKGMNGINTRKKVQINNLDKQTLKNIDQYKFDYKIFKSEKNIDKYKTTNFKLINLKALKKAYKKELEAAQIWKEGSISALTFKFDYINGKIEANGNKEKHLNIIKEKIGGLKSELSLQTNIIKMDPKISEETKKIQINALKSEISGKINVLKEQKIKYITEAKTQILALKERHITYKARVKNEPLQLQQIMNDVNVMILAAKDKFEAGKYELELAIVKQHQAIDINSSKVVINNVEKVYEGLTLAINPIITNIKNHQNIDENYVLLFKKLNEAKKNVDKLLTKKVFEAYDEQYAIKKRLQLALKIRKIIINYISDFEIYKNQNQTKLIKQQTKQVLVESKVIYDESFNKLQTEIANKKEQITTDTKKVVLEDILQLQNNFYETIETKITKITTKVVKSKGAL